MTTLPRANYLKELEIQIKIEKANYTNAIKRNEYFENLKVIRLRIKELERKLESLNAVEPLSSGLA